MKGIRRNIRLLAVHNFLTDFKFHSAVLVIYFAQVTGSFTLAMSLFSVIMISGALFEVPTGMFSDRIGRKKTVIFGAVSACLSAVFYAVGGSYWMLFTGALLEGLQRAWYSGNNDALLYESLEQSGKEETFAHYLGKTSAMFQLALMIGAVVGSVVAEFSFPLIMWLSVIPQVGAFIVSLHLTEPSVITRGKSNVFSHLSVSALRIWNNGRLRLLSLQDILRFGMGESSFQFNAAFIQTLWPVWAIGISRLLSYGGAFISYWNSSKIIRRIGEHNVLMLANFLTRTVNFVAYGFPSVISPVLMGMTSLTYGASEISKTTLMQKEFSGTERATLASLNSFFGHIFYGIFSPFLGYVADSAGPAKALIMVQIFMFGVLYIQWRLKRMSRV